jgi:hypothetical protein
VSELYLSDGTLVTNYNDISDGHHTFRELYDYRMLYNAALFNEWYRSAKYDVHKSLKHSDGQYCFSQSGGMEDWFIVVAQLPTGQISNHYRVSKHWRLFNIEERELSAEYDGHTPAIVAKRLEEFLQGGW